MKGNSKIYLAVIVLLVVAGAIWYAIASEMPVTTVSHVPQGEAQPTSTTASTTASTTVPEGITIDTPQPGDVIEFPVSVEGLVNGGGWIAFEGYAGSARVVDANGKEIVPQTPLMATTEWTQLPVSFKGILGSATSTAATVSGTIIIESENPKGDTSGKEFRIPVRFK